LNQTAFIDFKPTVFKKQFPFLRKQYMEKECKYDQEKDWLQPIIKIAKRYFGKTDHKDGEYSKQTVRNDIIRQKDDTNKQEHEEQFSPWVHLVHQ
jgi:hypothetical protein